MAESPILLIDRVPILGKPFEILGQFVTVMIRCRCEAMTPLLIVGVGGRVTCPACRNVYVVAKGGGAEVGLIAHVDEPTGAPS